MRLTSVPVRLTAANGDTLTVRNLAGDSLQVGDYDDLINGSPESTVIAGSFYTLTGPASKWINSAGSSDVDIVSTDDPANSVTDTSENLIFSKALGTFSTTNQVFVVGAVMFPLQVMACSLVVTSGSVSSSDTDYWTFQLGKIPSLSSSFSDNVAAEKTTQSNGGAAMFNLQAWNYDAVVFDEGNSVYVKDDLIAIRGVKTGVPGNATSVEATVRYKVL
jgi:hypothetical protein